MSAFVAQREGGGLPKAIVISGAGTEEANGIYKATDKEYCSAPVYEHMDQGGELKITREPHTNPKTGATKHGWLLGLRKSPLYGAPTESLGVPATGWKRFSGTAPVPTVVVHEQLADVFFSAADDAKTACDAAAEREDWRTAIDAVTYGIDALKRSGERFGDPFKNRAALLLSRRANAYAKLKDHRLALRDAIAALELVRSLTSAEVVAVESAKVLGKTDDAAAQKVLESVGAGRILDSGAPLVLRCVERWIDDVLENMKSAGDAANLEVPEPRHMAADRYLDGLDDKTRTEILKQYLPDAFKPPGEGGTGMIHNAKECLSLMHRWEQVFSGPEFQKQKRELWDRQGLSYPVRLQKTRDMVAGSLKDVLEPMGYQSGRPGLSRVVKQMQVYWSQDKACANKAMDLEELADVSLADLE
mmetsp:Transcript_91599/g.286651  ORF Transcript_91599/g.286651 Transcript_91599/m.286651 type:complete len:417 (-) Transcript_91599:84-1334(-)